MRGESQKPVTDGYRDNWEAIFNNKTPKLTPKSKKAPPVRTEPCVDCFGTGYEVSEKGDVASCFACGGEGVIPLET